MPLPKGQDWFISRMQKMGYKASSEGVCFGLAHMAMQAILAGEIDVFDERLEKINSLPLDSIVQTINDLKDQRKKTKNLPIDPLLEIPVFFEGVELYHKANFYLFLFEEENKPTAQNAMAVAPLILPQVLKENNIEISNPAIFTGAYNQEELIEYFHSLRSAVQQSDPPLLKPFTMILRSAKHVITVAYDPKKDEWLFIDPNTLPTQHITGSNNIIAKKVLSAFSSNSITTFTTEIYTTNTNKTPVEACVNTWKQQEAWKKIHIVSEKKAAAVDSSNTSWLYIAAKKGLLETVNALLTAKANVNLVLPNGATPLLIAAQNGHLKVVKALLAAGANVNLALTNGATPLLITAQNGYLEVVKALLAAGADVNLACTNGMTPLFTAAQDGHLEIVKALLARGAKVDLARTTDGSTPLLAAAFEGHLEVIKALLAAGANINIARPDGATPLFMAIQNGHIDVVRLLLSKGANIDAALKSDAKSLREFSKTYNVESRMNTLIEKKQSTSTPSISITCEEMATVMDHSEIKETFIKFKKLDEFVLNLRNISRTYHSKTLFHSENKERKTSIEKIFTETNRAYDSFASGVEINKVISTLKKTAEKISLDTKKDHRKRSPILSLFFTKSRLAKQIDTVLTSIKAIA